jgi:hypothetical protein
VVANRTVAGVGERKSTRGTRMREPDDLVLHLLEREGVTVVEAIMATPYTGSFIAATCNSRSSHGQVHPFTKWDKVRCYVL